ncbi:5'-nucleotidase [Nocardioides sp. J9]|uniref:bifunctional metallophosphatase/5'-nucleotidase n=1 Tax=Nocardioides sp. J9 TaxID=935844 RepID=UPI00119EC4FC|nr:bifunctional UDP-sugar hydrolase/5'-nucleotidase [Nocardioides sp. J9]TWG93460.1 5'-nucleotidase [Nocardioides sp. J9]
MAVSRSLRIVAAAVVALPGLALAAGPDAQAKPHGEIPVRLLALNDFHGNLEPPTGSSGRMVDETGATVEAGGAVYAAAWMKQLEDENTLKVAQGDAIGATPLISAAYHDEPTLEFLEHLGVTASAVGNHEFDEGYDELVRLINGGSHPVDGDSPAGPWDGTDFDYLGANVLLDDATKLPDVDGFEVLKRVPPGQLKKLLAKHGVPALPPVAVREVNGVRVGFIGAVTETTPTIVTAAGIEGLTFNPVVESAKFGSELLSWMGVRAQVLLVHEGDQVTAGQSPDACSTAPDPDGSAGAGTTIATDVDPEIDLILSGHSHQAYVCTVTDPAGNPRLYSQGGSFGRVISQADFKVDRKSGDVIRSTVTVDNHVVTRDIAPDPATAAFVQDWRDRVAAVANQQVGTITADLNRAQTAVGESVLGNVIADAQLEATRTGGGAQVALMNPGGIRADLAFAPDGVVTYGEAFAVQPFSNLMQVVTLTGAQLDALLEQQWTAARTAVLSPSSTLRYTATLSAPFGDRVSDITIDGVPLDPAASYRVAANNFLVGGGDGFSEFLNGTDLWSGPIDLDAFTAYLTAHSPISPPARDRITAG